MSRQFKPKPNAQKKPRPWLLIDVPRPKPRERVCPNCQEKLGTDSGHLVPPCFGDPGLWTCEKKNQCRG